MDTRTRFLAVMNFEPVDRTLLWEDGYWLGAVRRWYREGLPKRQGVPQDIGDGMCAAGGSIPWDPISDDIPPADDINESLGLDESLRRIPVNNYFSPPFTEEVLEDRGDWVVRRDSNGVIRRDRKDRMSLPGFIGWPGKCRAAQAQPARSTSCRMDCVGRAPEITHLSTCRWVAPGSLLGSP